MKYAIERTYDRSVMANGPTYYQALLTDPTYPGPYKDRSKNLMGLTAIDTPNATTLVFHLQAPFPDLPYVLAFPNTAPVLPSADTGSNYQLHPLSTGPYMFKSYTLNKQLIMVDNPNWNPATDPNAKQLATQIIVNMNVNQADIDNNLIAGNADIDAYGAGVGPAAQARILGSSSLKANADNPINGFARFVYINTKVAPLTNLHCREAVEYAANKTTMQTSWGGPVAGGAIASTIMPPVIVGYKSFDYYNALTQPTGDITAAKQQLTMCGQPNGFTTNMAYRVGQPAGDRGGDRTAGLTGRSRDQADPEGIPERSLLHQLRRRPRLRACARHRAGRGRLGRRLAGRLRLPGRAPQRELDRGYREHQHLRDQRPGDQQPVHRVQQAHRRRPGRRSGRRSTSRP